MSMQYAERDASALDEAGGYYIRHVSAMTKEGLHSKSDIAAELGFRDMRIDQLNHRINQLLTERNATGLAIERAISGQLPLTDHPLAERFRMIAGLSATRNALEVQVNNHEQHRDELLASLQRLISSDPHIEMITTSELEICANNEALPPTLREQAASVIQARAVIAMVNGGAA